ncbi:uncharacterized protein LOC110919854 [Helianthus annuus]|uniref:uncharacterized protein LOC110919854 n=1 Tax=Helianthus annuus TaxID=4232 RepID=UPI000B8FCBFF|nr:uncharacterized protein LOC110919854 [Helianthus annuus]
MALYLMLCDYSPYHGPDRWVWGHDNSENFTVASIKRIAELIGRAVPEYQFVWNSYVPKKVGIVPWRALLERLPTRVALTARSVNIGDTSCVLCGDYEETSEHLFVSCQFAQSVWLVMAQWCKSPPVIAFSLRDILDAHMFLPGSKKKKKVFGAISHVVIWSLWKMRNEVLFGEANPSVSKVVEESKSMSYHWVKNRSKSSHWSWGEGCSFNLVM